MIDTLTREQRYTAGWRSFRDGVPQPHLADCPSYRQGWADAEHAIKNLRDIGWSARDSSLWHGVVKAERIDFQAA